jgi:predicted amidohydrolase YtcJ
MKNNASSDMAFINGKIITVNPADEIAEAVAVKGNKISYVGHAKGLCKAITDRTKIYDLAGRSMVPGFIDTHFHPILRGLFGTSPNSAIIDTGYDNCKSIEDILGLIKTAVKSRRPGEWISMMGYDQNRIKERRHVTIKELDEVAPDNPVQCMRTCGHISVYNSKALESIGVYKASDVTKYPLNEIVVKDGNLTGMVKDHTHFYIWSKVSYTKEQQEAAALKSNDLLLKNGITSVHDAGECDDSSYRIMQRLCKERKFKPRQYMMIHSIFGKPVSLNQNEHFMKLGLLTGLGDPFFRIGSSKFMIDGGTSGPSCATREPYSHDPDTPGILGWERGEVADYLMKINNACCQATAHAVGDLAIEFMVEGYERANALNPRPDARHRIEHCAMVDQNLLNRIAKLSVCPSCNPGFIAWNGSNYERYFGDRMKYFIALKSMIDAHIMVSIGSDAPSGPVEPMTILDACVNRRDHTTGRSVDQTQAVSVLEAVRLYTYNGAYSSHEERIKGSIEPGKLADLTMLSEDLLSCPNDRIRDILVDMTIVDGIIEYERPQDC